MEKIIKTVLIILIPIILIGIIGGMIFINSLTETEHGKLDMDVAILLQIMQSGGEKWGVDNIPIKQQRDNYEAACNDSFIGKPEPISTVREKSVPGPAGDIAIRMYKNSNESRLPILVFFHGGGYVLGNLNATDLMVRYLAKSGKAVIVSVDYRLAPENPFPAGLEDGYAVLEWIEENAAELGGDGNKIGIAGDSSGGNYAAALALMLRDRRGPDIKFQGLFYPILDWNNLDTESFEKFGEGYSLTKESIKWFRTKYLPVDSDWDHPYASPVYADNLAGLPVTYMVTAAFDPLQDTHETYEKKLKADGVEVVRNHYDGVVHGFSSLGDLVSKSYPSLDFILDGFIKTVNK